MKRLPGVEAFIKYATIGSLLRVKQSGLPKEGTLHNEIETWRADGAPCLLFIVEQRETCPL